MPNSDSSNFVNTKTKKVHLIVFMPQDVSGRPLNEIQKWNDPLELANDFILDIYKTSRRSYRYVIDQTTIIKDFPVLSDGYKYSLPEYSKLLSSPTPPHEPSMIDYREVVRLHGIIEDVSTRDIDEVWLFGGPWFGFYESCMGGPDAFWCNGPAIPGTELAEHRFVVMGFNYEKGVAEMLESFIHRGESILSKVYRGFPPEKHMWNRFTQIDKTHPDRAGIGTCHFAPNSIRDYEWGSRKVVLSSCEDWLNNYPKLRGIVKTVDCAEWGNGDARLHHLWWMAHLPHGVRFTDGVYNNWWHYIMTPDWVKL